MANIDLDDILGLIDSNKGEIICRECLKEEELPHIPEEEVITQEGCWSRGVPEWYVAGVNNRGRQEGRPYPWSQQVIHEICGLT